MLGGLCVSKKFDTVRGVISHSVAKPDAVIDSWLPYNFEGHGPY